MKHCQTRWLSLLRVIERVLHQYPALAAYFASHEDGENHRVKRVVDRLAAPTTTADHIFQYVFYRFSWTSISCSRYSLAKFNNSYGICNYYHCNEWSDLKIAIPLQCSLTAQISIACDLGLNLMFFSAASIITMLQADETKVGALLPEMDRLLRTADGQVCATSPDPRTAGPQDTDHMEFTLLDNQHPDDTIAIGMPARAYLAAEELDPTQTAHVRFVICLSGIALICRGYHLPHANKYNTDFDHGLFKQSRSLYYE